MSLILFNNNVKSIVDSPIPVTGAIPPAALLLITFGSTVSSIPQPILTSVGLYKNLKPYIVGSSLYIPVLFFHAALFVRSNGICIVPFATPVPENISLASEKFPAPETPRTVVVVCGDLSVKYSDLTIGALYLYPVKTCCGGAVGMSP